MYQRQPTRRSSSAPRGRIRLLELVEMRTKNYGKRWIWSVKEVRDSDDERVRAEDPAKCTTRLELELVCLSCYKMRCIRSIIRFFEFIAILVYTTAALGPADKAHCAQGAGYYATFTTCRSSCQLGSSWGNRQILYLPDSPLTIACGLPFRHISLSQIQKKKKQIQFTAIALSV